jgi:hypothetical protein
MIMPFGCFKGLPVGSLPREYLKCLSENVDLWEPLKKAVFSALGESTSDQPAARQLPFAVLAAVSEGATVAGPRGPQRRWLMAANRCAGRLDQPPAQEFTAGRREGHSCVGTDKPRPQCGGKPLWARQRSAKLR